MIDHFEIITISDSDQIDILHGRSSGYLSLHYSYDEEVIDLLKRNFTLKDSLYLLVTDMGEFAGYCSIDSDWWEEGFFFLREIFVEPSFQKQGLGKKLMGMCLDHAKKIGAQGVVTETAFENESMQKLCLSFGFEKWDNPQWKEGVTFKLIF